ncbi:MAG: phosphopantetheine-binding protein [Firmicutes bacterium]|nr:phosphopantetheine-binding protein [Bacillota bacterium]
MVETVQSIVSNLVNLQKPIEEISLDDNLLILGMDSIASLKVVVELKNEYDIEFDNEILTYDNLKSISSIVNCVETLRNGNREI